VLQHGPAALVGPASNIDTLCYTVQHCSILVLILARMPQVLRNDSAHPVDQQITTAAHNRFNGTGTHPTPRTWHCSRLPPFWASVVALLLQTSLAPKAVLSLDLGQEDPRFIH
jgi:hypothetical protein